MALQEILNGTFDWDPSAEKVRESFDKVKAMFAEIYGSIPLDAELTGNQGLFLKVKTDESGFELVALAGGGDMLGSNNLSDVDDPAASRTNLGLGSAAESDASDFATAAQGTKADSAIQTINNGGGVSIDVTDPQNPVISFNGATVTGMSINALTKVLTLEVSGGADIALDMSNYLTLLIGGLHTIKGAGNTNVNAHENDDRAFGWEGDKFIAFKQVGGSRSYALNQGIL